ncbi:hypothetical protein [Microbacterium sp. GXF7504]
MMARRTRQEPAIDWRVLVTGNAADVVDALTTGARVEGLKLVEPGGPALANVAIAAVRTSKGSTLALGIKTLDALSDSIEPDAPRVVVAVRAKLAITPDRFLAPLVREILFQVEIAATGVEGTRKQRKARARFGSALLDAAGLHVFRVGRMRL